jgi:hypothetical protein
LELSGGDYLIVKQDLTAGEYRDLMRAATRPITVAATASPSAAAPTMELDPIAAGMATVLAYLLDWSFQDADGEKLVILDQPPAMVRAALDNIESDAYMEVQRAIQAHQERRAAVLADEKKTRNGAPISGGTLVSAG